MIYLFSSSPATIAAYFERKEISYTLVEKEMFGVFMHEYIPKPGDWGLVYDFGKIIPTNFIEALFLLNIHFSLLPKHRGAVPVEAALLAGDAITGITVQKMAATMDSGDILLQREVEIMGGESAGELQARMDGLLPEMLDLFVDIPPEKWSFSVQVGEPTYCYMRWLDRENAQVDVKRMAAEEVVRKIKAYNPEPMAWMVMKKRGEPVVVNLLRGEIIAELQLETGVLSFVKKRGLALGTAGGTVLITELVIAGSKLLKGGDIVALKGSLELGITNDPL